MKISQDFKCFIGLHKYEVIKEEVVFNEYYRYASDDNINKYIVGKVIISKCTNCGKLKITYVKTIYER